MDFYSERQSMAEQFAEQTENNSNLHSSRRLQMEAESDLAEFRSEIHFKFIRSIANKTYTFPLNEEAYDLFNDEEEYQDLYSSESQPFIVIDLYQQPPLCESGFKKQQFKKANKQLSLTDILKAEREKIQNLRLFVKENLCGISHDHDQSLLTKNGLYLDNVRDKEKSERKFQVIYEAPHEQYYKRKRLQTEPYEKPMGFIIKRK